VEDELIHQNINWIIDKTIESKNIKILEFMSVFVSLYRKRELMILK